MLDRLDMTGPPVAELNGASSTTCSWRSRGETHRLNLVINHAVGLAELEQLGGAFDERTPLTVAGYPAIRLDHVDSPTCRIAVGVADSQTVSAGASSLSTDAPPLCDLARSLAEEVVAALREP